MDKPCVGQLFRRKTATFGVTFCTARTFEGPENWQPEYCLLE